MFRSDNLLCFILVVLFLFPVPAKAQVYSPRTSNPEEGVCKHSQMILAKLLKDMGLDFDDEKKVDPEKQKRKKDEKKKDPEKKEKQQEKKKSTKKTKDKDSDSDFWADDDDFFKNDDDFDNKSYDDVVDSFEKEFADAVAAWDKEYEETVSRWNKAKKIYNKNQKKYAASTYDIRMFASAGPQSPAAPLASTGPASVNINGMKPGQYHVIPYALEIPVKQQAYRGTCAAFAGIRTIEIVLSQYESRQQKLTYTDLSEQHFYWLSRPECMETPCSSDGSFFDYGYLNSGVDDPKAAIKLERDCPYISNKNGTNATYTPLAACNQKQGAYKVTQIHRNLILGQVLGELASNRPVAAGIKVPDSFFSPQGLVTSTDPQNRCFTKAGDHTKGHAIVFVGFIKLPQRYWSKEGKFCFITANSWGEGWGAGGYTCLTQTWVQEFGLQKMLTSVEEVQSVQN